MLSEVYTIYTPVLLLLLYYMLYILTYVIYNIGYMFYYNLFGALLILNIIFV